MKDIRERGPDLVVVSRVDWARSLALGEKWRKQTLELPSPKPIFEKSREIQRGEAARSTQAAQKAEGTKRKPTGRVSGGKGGSSGAKATAKRTSGKAVAKKRAPSGDDTSR